MRIKKEDKDKLLSELREVPFLSPVCKYLHIPRATLYRQMQKDKTFADTINEAIKFGKENVSDHAESRLLDMIKKGYFPAVRYWLESNRKNYIRPRPKGFFELLNPPEGSRVSLQVVKACDHGCDHCKKVREEQMKKYWEDKQKEAEKNNPNLTKEKE